MARSIATIKVLHFETAQQMLKDYESHPDERFRAGG